MRTLGLFALLGLFTGQPVLSLAADAQKNRVDEKQIRHLIGLLGSNEFNVREQAAEQLIANGRLSLGALISALRHSDAEIRRRAEKCLDEIQRHAPLDDLLSPYAPTRVQAIRRLEQSPPRSAQAITPLLKALEDEHPEIRSRALGVLAAMGVERKVLVARMVKMMNDENQPVQVRWVIAATHLPQLGTDAESALPDVMRLAKTSNSKLSTDPRFSLGLLGADYELRAAAYLALGKIGKDHSEVIPVLLEGLHDVNSTARGNAAWGIGTIRQAPELCVSALLQALQRPTDDGIRDDERSCILRALAAFGARARVSIPAIVQLARNPKESARLRRTAIFALVDLGPEAKTALTELSKLTEPEVAADAKSALLAMQREHPDLFRGEPP